jgi:peptidoglycan/LPS O-acetylase OafA/YrhL
MTRPAANQLAEARRTLGDHSAGRDNHFNLIRFVAATAVLVSHGYALSTGDPRTEPLRQLLGVSLGDIAVAVFFATSGFLVAGSLLAKQNAVGFFVSRALRIYPGLIVAIVLTVVVFGCFYSELGAAEFFTHRATWRYVITNTLMLGRESYVLPGVFAHLPLANAVNGSLWSLPVEIRMYMVLGAGWIACTLASKAPVASFKAFCVAVAALAMAVDLGFLAAHRSSYEAYQSPLFADLLAAFFSGAVLRVFQHRVPASRAIFGTVVAVLLTAAATTGFLVAYKLALAYVVLYLALVPRGPLLAFNRLGDYSYGMYIYAFAVQQMVVHAVPGITPLRLIVFSFVPTVWLAFASWHLVEKRALRWRLRLERPLVVVTPPADQSTLPTPLGGI